MITSVPKLQTPQPTRSVSASISSWSTAAIMDGRAMHIRLMQGQESAGSMLATLLLYCC